MPPEYWGSTLGLSGAVVGQKLPPGVQFHSNQSDDPVYTEPPGPTFHADSPNIAPEVLALFERVERLERKVTMLEALESRVALIEANTRV